jgi:anti-sigma regulatory factor (Ser/Thr protein kinase)
MKFSEDRKQNIKMYLLEKIEQHDRSVAKTVAEVFDVNASTVHAYIKELVRQEIIVKKEKRGEYELKENNFEYVLKRENGDLDTDMYAVEHCLQEHISDLPGNVQNIWNYTFSEMINNVMDHSEAEQVHIVISQNYLETRVMISDNGVGIFNKIMNHFNFQSVDEAICELFKGKLTTDSENHSGEGIFFSSKMMDSFFIVSSGKIFTNNKYEDSRIVDMASVNTKGTLVIMGLSNFSNKEAKEVFDLYANVDGGFVKTTIPMKNIFPVSPVSRSQAKRVCNRLDKFQEVIIDFEGITWIGQAFAHQLFVVFAKNHQDIKLSPINMNEDVTKMYNHVIADQ